MWLVTFVFVVLLLTLIIFRRRQKLKLPPGPTGYPVIGNIFDVKNVELIHQDLVRFRKAYGDIVHFKMFNQNFISLSTPELLREAFSAKANAKNMADRPPSNVTKKLYHGDDVGFVNYKPAASRRKLLHKFLHLYGEGIQSLETTVSSEVELYLQKIRSFRSLPFDPGETLFGSLSNVVCLLLIGEKFDLDHIANKNIDIFLKELNYMLSGGIDTLLGYVPFLLKLPLRFRDHFIALQHAMDILIDIFFTQQKATFDSEHPRGIVDRFLQHQLELKGTEKDTLTDSNIDKMTVNILAGGIITTHGTLLGMLLVFLHYPDVQKKLQEECDEIQRRHGRRPILTDKKSMPYTQATITEALRFLSPFPVSLPHSCAETTTLAGYDIPAGTTILSNLWGIQHDERYWQRPFEFEPRRFLDSEGNVLPPENPACQRVLAFGLGKRACPGEIFARSRLFLYLTSLMCNFTFVPGEDRALPSCDPRDTIPGVIVTYPVFTVKAIPRNT